MKQRGEAAFAEASALALNLREAISSLNAKTAEGVPVMEAARKAVAELSRGLLESDLSAQAQAESLKDLRQALLRYIEAVSAGMVPESAFNAVLAFQTQQMSADAVATSAAANSAGAGIPFWLGMAGVIALVSAVLSPFIALVGGAAVVLTAFAIAGAGTLTLLGGLAVGFGAIGAVVTALGLSAMGGTDPGATLEKTTAQLNAAQQALANFDRIHPGGLTTTTTGPSEAAGRRLYDAQQALADFHAAHPNALTPAQVREQEDLNLRLARAEADYHSTTKTSGGLTVAQQVEREKLINKLADAQEAYNAANVNAHGPMNTLREDVEGMLAVWGKMAAPLTAQILIFADKFIPAITATGEAVIKWFGDRLPGVLNGLSTTIKGLAPDFEAFGKFLGATFDKVFGQTSVGSGGTIKTLGETFQDMVRGVIAATQGLIGNLAALSGWFLERLPAYGPVVSQIMSGVGSAIQGAAGAFGRFADWIVANWPSIMANVQTTLKNISDEWSKWAPVLLPIITTLLPPLGEALKNISNHAGVLVPLLLAATVVLVALATGAATLIGWITQLLNWLSLLSGSVQLLGVLGNASPLGGFIRDLDSAIGRAEILVGLLARIPGMSGGGGGKPPPNYGPGGTSTNSRQRGFGGAQP